MRTERLLVIVVGLFAAACVTARPSTDVTIAAAWVELGPGGVAQVRAISESAACPGLIVDGAQQAMRIRAASDGGSFAVTVCEASLAAGAREATVGGRWVPLPTASPRRIIVIGDTGCRMEAPDDFQACNDAAAWPFARIAATAAAWRPDVVIHLGDFHYRESPCPAGNAGCAGSPSGDNWPTWRADFFTPAEPLLRTAPWVFIRGNHELCSRAGQGWFRFLEPGPRPATCTDDTAPYVVRLGDVVLAVIDSSPASDSKAVPADVARYAAQLDRLATMKPPYTWLATHRPPWAVINIGGSPPTLATGNATLQAALDGRVPASLRLVLAGHVHLFEALGFGERRPVAMVVGNSGTLVDRPVPPNPAGMVLDGATVTTGKTLREFGFVVMDAVGDEWRATVRDVEGRPLAECTITGRTLACGP